MYNVLNDLGCPEIAQQQKDGNDGTSVVKPPVRVSDGRYPQNRPSEKRKNGKVGCVCRARIVSEQFSHGGQNGLGKGNPRTPTYVYDYVKNGQNERDDSQDINLGNKRKDSESKPKDTRKDECRNDHFASIFFHCLEVEDGKK